MAIIERPIPATTTKVSWMSSGQPSEWLKTRPAASMTSAPTRPMAMMLVRR